MYKPILLLAFVVVYFLAMRAAVAADDTQEEILALIQKVAVSDCQFERNGDLHDAEAAADHLRLKYRNGRRYATSTENFIDRLASSSSFTRRPYYIICPDSGRQRANDWLHGALQLLRAETGSELDPANATTN